MKMIEIARSRPIDIMRQRLQSGEALGSRALRFFSVLSAFCALSALPASEAFAAGKGASQKETETVFRYHVPSEPQSLDPSKLLSTDASYFFNNIMRGLYSYSNEKGLVNEGAESCVFETQTKLNCKLRESIWSDGTKVEAADYVRSFRRLVSSASKVPTVELLKRVHNAMTINEGKAPSESLGVRAEGKDRLVIELDTPDPDFLYKLTASVLVPVRNDAFPPVGELTGILFNGPYRVTQWVRGKRMRLESNPYYKRGEGKRPPVEVLFIDDDQTALTLYERKELSFLRRLPTTFIAKYRARPDFKQIPVARFDYVGFGEELRNQPDFRAALSFAADYREMQKMLDALGIPGCPSLPEELVDSPHCVKFDLARAKKFWEKVPADVKAKRYKFAFSKLGGDDIKRSMEWFQAQWKKNLGVQVDLEQTEQGTYLQMLRTSPPAIFRKGVGLERPTCLSALETFARDGSDNFLKIDDPVLEAIIRKLSDEIKPDKSGILKKPSEEAKETCGDGIQHLLDYHWMIPLGRIHFTLLADPHFQGWALNEMNQLDLAELQLK
jgi:oligopeptide transport system substrate-binding protein